MSETVNETKTRFEAFIKENYPDVDVAPGSVLSELLIKLSASVHNQVSNEIADLSSTGSLSAALASTTDTYSEVIDKIASNYNLTRSQGRKSVGKLKVYLARRKNATIKAGLTFLQPSLGLSYVLTTDLVVSPTADEVNGETKLFQVGEQYFFLAPVEATDVGSQFQVSDRTKFSLGADQTLTDFVVAEAYGNFLSGLPVETDKELITRLKRGLSNKGLLSEQSILANLQDRAFTVRDLTIVGSGDEEMTRSKQNDFGISTLGMADLYVRTSVGPETVTITKTAVKTDTATWKFTLGQDDAPGFYRVLTIAPVGTNISGSLEIVSQVFGYSTEGFDRTNVVNNAIEARFSRYQTCDVTFVYAESPVAAVGDQLDFEVVVSYQPNIADIQNVFLDDTQRIACADYFVKAVLPCFVSLGLRLFRKFPSDVIPTDKIKQDIFNYINTIPFGESLYVSKIIDICHNYSVKRVDLPITVTGEILCSDGTTISISSTDALEIPTNLAKGVSKNTTQFFIDYYTTGSDNSNLTDNIGIEVI